ncbi:hypothetical protein J7481_18415 [Labrenzia sp. R4_2]|uniref:hypothetical protein n=1 Tax=Labrenzia sp. R4_2 TaxID=2821107 RepID=UPI001ADABBB0|nr:hypothetical protein [Labrenzia sp. R4_2]MBO9421488.1 hypothetical protein [Labrenzia sp. R4_2]
MQNLKVKYIAEDHNVWAVHAGRYKRQYETFLENNVVFLELPGLPSAGVDFGNLQSVRQAIRMSDGVLKWIIGQSTNPPVRNLDAYDGNPIDIAEEGARTFNSQVGNVMSLFHQAKAGDLVLVPGKGHYKSVLIGEIETSFDSDDLILLRQYDDEATPFRRVNWLNTEIPKRNFSKYVSKRLENRHAVINLNKNWSDLNSISDDVYKFAYQNFIFKDQSHITLSGPTYNSKEPQGIFDATDLIKAVYAMNTVVGSGGADFRGQNIAQIIAQHYNGEQVTDFTFNFNSPGRIGFGSAALGAITVLGIISVALGGLSFEDALGGVSLEFNGEAAPTEVQNECNDRMRGILNSMNQGQYDELQKKCTDARNGIGLNVERP